VTLITDGCTHRFTTFLAEPNGALPISEVTIDTDGILYGTTSQGGSNNNGVVGMIKPQRNNCCNIAISQVSRWLSARVGMK